MKLKVTRGVDHRDPVAFIRDGKLYLACDIKTSGGPELQRNCILGSDGVVRTNGTGTIPGISGFGAEAIYPGDTVTITF